MRAKGDRAVGEVVTELDGTEMQQCLDPALPNDPPPSLPVRETLSKYKSTCELKHDQGPMITTSNL